MFEAGETTKNIQRVTGYVVPVGNGAVGKSCLAIILRNLERMGSTGEKIAHVRKSMNMEFEFITDRFQDKDRIFYVTQQLLTPPGQKELEGDTTGRSFEQVMDIYRFMVRRIDVVLLSYSITNLDSFQDLEFWVEKIDEYCSNHTHFILVGTHLDEDHHREVTPQDLEAGRQYIEFFLQEHRPDWYGKCLGVEVSNQSGANISQLKRTISYCILRAQKHIV